MFFEVLYIYISTVLLLFVFFGPLVLLPSGVHIGTLIAGCLAQFGLPAKRLCQHSAICGNFRIGSFPIRSLHVHLM